ILAKVGGYMVGSLALAALAGATSLVFLLITGIPYALALAFVVAIFDLIPQVGATLGAIVLTLVGLTVSVPVAIAALIFFILYQQLENWVIYPRVMRRTTAVSDLAAILGVLLGATLLGVVGVLIAIPATAAIQLIVREVVFPRQNTH
ncbi:MAG: AI-2E family transporter, partial [Dehalococcoidia bacterium]